VKILITGGAGFVGSHLADRFVEKGDTVVCLDNFATGDMMNIRPLINKRNFKLVKGDVRDRSLVASIMHDVDAVFHLAAQIHVDRSLVEPELTYQTNVMGTLNILEEARKNDVSRVIYASTSEVYGTARFAPMTEAHPLEASHPYGASKVAADRMCAAYIETYGLDIAIMRPFNLYGPRQMDEHYGGVIAIFVKRALAGKPPIIFGDGTQSRDYTYVSDIVTAYEKILMLKRCPKDPINFGTGIDLSINEIALKVLKYTGRTDMKPIHAAARPGEVKRLIADTCMARDFVDWKPVVDIDTGLQKYVEWYKARPERWT